MENVGADIRDVVPIVARIFAHGIGDLIAGAVQQAVAPLTVDHGSAMSATIADGYTAGTIGA